MGTRCRNAEEEKFFATASNLGASTPALHFPFDYYQHFMDMNSMRFVTSFLGFDVSGIIEAAHAAQHGKEHDGGATTGTESWHKTLMEEEGEQ